MVRESEILTVVDSRALRRYTDVRTIADRILDLSQYSNHNICTLPFVIHSEFRKATRNAEFKSETHLLRRFYEAVVPEIDHCHSFNKNQEHANNNTLLQDLEDLSSTNPFFAFRNYLSR